MNLKLAKRAGLLHDIGKVPDEDPELPHAILGMKIAQKIQTEMTYPGQVKVTVIREKRAVNYAK